MLRWTSQGECFTIIRPADAVHVSDLIFDIVKAPPRWQTGKMNQLVINHGCHPSAPTPMMSDIPFRGSQSLQPDHRVTFKAQSKHRIRVNRPNPQHTSDKYQFLCPFWRQSFRAWGSGKLTWLQFWAMIIITGILSDQPSTSSDKLRAKNKISNSTDIVDSALPYFAVDSRQYWVRRQKEQGQRFCLSNVCNRQKAWK